MYIAQAYKVLHEPWKYIVGAFLIFIVSQVVGGIPFMVALAKETMAKGEPFPVDTIEMMNVLEPNTTFMLMLIPFALGLIMLFGWVKLLHKQSITSLTTSRKKISWPRIFFAFGLWAIITIGLTYLDYSSNSEDYVWNFDLDKFLILAVIGVLLVPLQTSFEEYLFRGYLMQGLGVASGNRWLPLVITSVAFGLLHIANPEVDKIGYIILVYYIGTGFFLGIMTLMDEGLELAIGFHAANNLVTALLVTANWTVFQTHSVLKDMSEPAAGIDVLVPVFVIFPIILFIFAKVYKWKGWKEKLTGKVNPPVSEEIFQTEMK